MRLIERYIFNKIASATTLTFVALGTMVWLSQALRQFDLVTANGQSVLTFLYVSALIVPALVGIILPVALFIAVIYAFTNLNSGSELVIINASGATQLTVLRPVLLVGLIVAALVGSMSLYFAPLTLRAWQVLITNVRSDVLTTVMRPGEFMQPATGLTIHLRSRDPDGTLRGIFVSDDRDPNQTTTYLAERGAVLDNPVGVFLIMSNGTIQQRNKIDQSISMIEFTSYAFDLSSFASGGTTPQLRPAERDTTYLFHPDPDDHYFRQFPGKYRAELHNRFSSPLYALLFAVLPLVFLGQAEFDAPQPLGEHHDGGGHHDDVARPRRLPAWPGRVEHTRCRADVRDPAWRHDRRRRACPDGQSVATAGADRRLRRDGIRARQRHVAHRSAGAQRIGPARTCSAGPFRSISRAISPRWSAPSS